MLTMVEEKGQHIIFKFWTEEIPFKPASKDFKMRLRHFGAVMITDDNRPIEKQNVDSFKAVAYSISARGNRWPCTLMKFIREADGKDWKLYKQNKKRVRHP